MKTLSASLLVLALAACSKTTTTTTYTTIADAVTDFQGTQNPSTALTAAGTDPTKGTWSFGYVPVGSYNYPSFVSFTVRSYDVAGFETYGYMHPTSSLYPWIGKDCGIPTTTQLAVRRWTSATSGTLVVTGEVGMDVEHQTPGGTGNTVTLYKNGVSYYSKDLTGTDTTQYTYTVSDVAIASGDVLDFAIAARDNSPMISNFKATIMLKN